MDVIRRHYCLNNYCVVLFVFLLLSLLDCSPVFPHLLNESFNHLRRGRSLRKKQHFESFFSQPWDDLSFYKRVMSYATWDR